MWGGPICDFLVYFEEQEEETSATEQTRAADPKDGIERSARQRCNLNICAISKRDSNQAREHLQPAIGHEKDWGSPVARGYLAATFKKTKRFRSSRQTKLPCLSPPTLRVRPGATATTREFSWPSTSGGSCASSHLSPAKQKDATRWGQKNIKKWLVGSWQEHIFDRPHTKTHGCILACVCMIGRKEALNSVSTLQRAVGQKASCSPAGAGRHSTGPRASSPPRVAAASTSTLAGRSRGLRASLGPTPPPRRGGRSCLLAIETGKELTGPVVARANPRRATKGASQSCFGQRRKASNGRYYKTQR